MTATELIMIVVAALASGRIAVLFVHDTILDTPRDWLFRRFPPFDNLMHGYDYQSKDKDGNPLPASLKRKGYMISEVLTCTRCFTVWTTAPVYLAADAWQWAAYTTQVIAAMAVAAWVAKKL